MTTKGLSLEMISSVSGLEIPNNIYYYIDE
jgi:hypothetical protein